VLGDVAAFVLEHITPAAADPVSGVSVNVVWVISVKDVTSDVPISGFAPPIVAETNHAEGVAVTEVHVAFVPLLIKALPLAPDCDGTTASTMSTNTPDEQILNRESDVEKTILPAEQVAGTVLARNDSESPFNVVSAKAGAHA
jgi:hypothetical protein